MCFSPSLMISNTDAFKVLHELLEERIIKTDIKSQEVRAGLEPIINKYHLCELRKYHAHGVKPYMNTNTTLYINSAQALLKKRIFLYQNWRELI